MSINTQNHYRDSFEGFISVDLDGSMQETGLEGDASVQSKFTSWRENPFMSTILESNILRPVMSALAFIALTFAADYAKKSLTPKVNQLEIMPGLTGETVANTYVDSVTRLAKNAIVSTAKEGDEEVLDPFITAYRHWRAATNIAIYQEQNT